MGRRTSNTTGFLDRLNTVRLRLILISLLPILTFAFVGSLVYSQRYRPFVVDQYGDDIHTTLELKGFFTESWLQDRLKLVSFLAGSPAAVAWDVAAMNRVASTFAGTFSEFSAAVFVAPDGRTAVDSAAPGPPGGFVGDRPYFQRAMAGEANISPVVIGRTSGRPIVIFAAPVFDSEGVVQGVAFAPVRLDTLDRLISEMSAARGIFTSLLDSAGTLVTTGYPESPEEHDVVAGAIAVEEIPRVPGIYKGPDGAEVLGARMEIEPDGWTLIAEAPLSAITEVFQQYNFALLVAAVAGAALWIVLALVTTSTLLVPIRRLDAMSRAIAADDYETARTTRVPRRAPLELKRLHGTIQDMARIVDARQNELERVSLTDELTALANRRYLEGEARRLFSMCAMADQPCSLMVIDADHFKQVNDTLGHDVGDRVLVELARSMSRILRTGDFLARYGGEEFVAVLPRTACEEAMQLADRLRRQVAEEGLDIEDLTWPVTLSIGVVAVPLAPGLSPEEAGHAGLLDSCVARADEQMYAAKRAGRDRVRGDCALPAGASVAR